MEPVKKKKHSRRRRRNIRLHVIQMLLLGLLLGLAGYYVHYLHRPGTAPVKCPPKSVGELRVATVNIGLLGVINSPDMVAEFLQAAMQRLDVDVVLVQEYVEKYKFRFPEFRKIFEKSYPYVSFEGEQAIVSRLPFEPEQYEDFDMSHGSYASYLLHVDDSTDVRLISAHLYTTGISGLARLGDTNVGDYATAVTSSGKVRNYQAEVVSRLAAGSDCPVVVAGDYNSLPLSKAYRVMRKAGLQDSYLAAGRGNGSTFRNFKNLLRIDYVMPDANFCVTHHLVCDDFLSDHRMVVATLSPIPLR